MKSAKFSLFLSLITLPAHGMLPTLTPRAKTIASTVCTNPTLANAFIRHSSTDKKDTSNPTNAIIRVDNIKKIEELKAAICNEANAPIKIQALLGGSLISSGLLNLMYKKFALSNFTCLAAGGFLIYRSIQTIISSYKINKWISKINELEKLEKKLNERTPSISANNSQMANNSINKPE